jgi:hypothetical protein
MRSISGMMIAGLIGTLLVPSVSHARGFGAARGGVAVNRGGGVAVNRGGAVAVNRGGGVAAGGVQRHTFIGPAGGSVQAGRVGGVSSGPFGGVHAAGAQGARITTPAGRTVTTGSAGRVNVGPAGGVRAGGVRAGGVAGPYGGAAFNNRVGVSSGPFGGVAIGGSRTVAIGHSTRYVSPAVIRGNAGFVRTGYYGGAFTRNWYGVHVNAWRPVRWAVPNYWAPVPWVTMSAWCGIAAPPVVYDYGSTVIIENNNVYINGEQAATAPQYAQQAVQIADTGRAAQPAKEEEWQPLGVFGLIQQDEKIAQNIFQLAVNKAGVLRGNYYNSLDDSTQEIYGSVDPKSQRAAWSIGQKKTIVYEAGLNNLTQEQTPVLIHYGTERTEQMFLVRLEQPKDGK